MYVVAGPVENARRIAAHVRRLSGGVVKTPSRIFWGVVSIAVLGVFVPAAFVCAQPPGAAAEDVVGIWQGALKTSGIELRLVFKIVMTSGRKLSATLDSPDQGATDIPVDEVTFESGALRMKIKAVLGTYEGTLADDGRAITGQWSQAGFTLPLDLARVSDVPRVRRPQEPTPPYPYDEEDVAYENKTAGLTLAGTLTLPRSGRPVPAVVLISGSGPQDRDETVFGHRPFLVLADHLTRRGIAVLRVDDRGVGRSTGSFAEATSEDFATDVLGGIDYLKQRKEVDPRRIGLIGHSEGGIVAPIVAARSADVAFIVLMAGTGLTGEEILYLQAARIASVNGASDEAIAKNRAHQARVFSILKREKNDEAARQQIRRVLTEALEELSEEDRKALRASDATVELQSQQLVSPWFRFFLTYDPRPTLEKVKCPVLAINGEKDLQVPPKENLRAIAEALAKGGNRQVVTRELPGLNHLFQTADAGSPAEYARTEETLSPVVLALIADWIVEQTGKPK